MSPLSGIYFIFKFETSDGNIVEVAGRNAREARELYRRTYKEEPKRLMSTYGEPPK